MSRRYDSRTTIFSPEGRLYQVEYALKAIEHAGAAVGVLCTDGVVLGTERKVTSRLLESVSSDKMSRVDGHVAVAVAGITADANTLVEYLRIQSQAYTRAHDEPMPVEALLRRVCDMKQGYTQYGGLRPFGVSLLYAGWDDHHGFQLYQSDPSGNYGGWRAAAIGANSAQAQALFKTAYDPEMAVSGGLALALKTLHKTMDSASIGKDKVDFATLTRENGKVVYTVLSEAEIEKLIETTDLGQPEN
eukprot:TRINITY_DN2367_c0_g3_i1.p2 TRINITY_DN2367_c0_g3~~TRINITY_DN2367_c0_g3_i1.p2  ORF type:complete len:246 (+),score=77.88 TRINITY_DN2367_c0_g3_i1:118-855(+)